jgi:methyltransferase (TIGR00027 family)
MVRSIIGRSAGARPQATDSGIQHVSDTAFWVADCRAHEGRRADAAFDDPLAATLSGEQGRAIARSMPRAALVEWSMIIRTSAIDRLIHDALSAGVDTVLNLGAGLDTRPYRMKLAQALRWVEVDFPRIVDLKNVKLNDRQSACKLERIGIDLLDCSARNGILARYAEKSKKILVITEGVLTYFSLYDAATLAADIHACGAIGLWIQDFDNTGQGRPPRGWAEKLKAAPMVFNVKDWFGFFEKYGWRSARVITSFEESQRINRPYPLDFPYGLLLRALPREVRQRIHSSSGAVLMQRIDRD